MPKIPRVDYASASQTILIAVNTECHFCTESIPFYNELAKLQQMKDKGTRIIAVFPNAESEVQQYVKQNQLQVEAIAGVDLKTFNVRGTPTMILVDRNGKVLNFWIGKLSEDEKKQAVNILTAPKM
ncbi:MAG TPA: redoxin family protein [Pyrinomonadaceae bacterium]|nr:redoxin family protein [Pyrinomonadaceae bacterium]